MTISLQDAVWLFWQCWQGSRYWLERTRTKTETGNAVELKYKHLELSTSKFRFLPWYSKHFQECFEICTIYFAHRWFDQRTSTTNFQKHVFKSLNTILWEIFLRDTKMGGKCKKSFQILKKSAPNSSFFWHRHSRIHWGATREGHIAGCKLAWITFVKINEGRVGCCEVACYKLECHGAILRLHYHQAPLLFA